jgi:hypothetical protein
MKRVLRELTWSPFRPTVTIGCVLSALACGEAATQPDLNGRGTHLSAEAPSQINGTVGTSVSNTVLVKDAGGRAVAGVIVIFSVRSGGGIVHTPSVISGIGGIARAEWTLGTVPGDNVLAATNLSGDTVLFTVNAVAGPPFQLQKIEGDGQIAPPGATLGIRPRVKLTDVYGNSLSGVTVRFTVEAGGGSVAGNEATTDFRGIAESGAWVLGLSGTQLLVARAGPIASEPFMARAFVPPPACATADTLPLSASLQSALTPVSCKDGDGRSIDVFPIVVKEAGAFVFTMTSTDFDTRLELRDDTQQQVATNENTYQTTTNSSIKILLIPGVYKLYAASSNVGEIGSYTLKFQQSNTDPDHCEDAFIVRGISAAGVVNSGDCTSAPDKYSDRFRIYLEAGSFVVITVKDFSYSGPNVEVNGPRSQSYASPNGLYTTTLTFQAPDDGYYTVLVGLLNEIGVKYELVVR